MPYIIQSNIVVLRLSNSLTILPFLLLPLPQIGNVFPSIHSILRCCSGAELLKRSSTILDFSSKLTPSAWLGLLHSLSDWRFNFHENTPNIEIKWSVLPSVLTYSFEIFWFLDMLGSFSASIDALFPCYTGKTIFHHISSDLSLVLLWTVIWYQNKCFFWLSFCSWVSLFWDNLCTHFGHI